MNKRRHPDWLKVPLLGGKNFSQMKKLLASTKLSTICEEAKCPNLAECWNNRTATYMILGDTCTRTCGFCDVKSGRPMFVDWDEPNRVVQSVVDLGLKHVVITSVNRDELKDGGAGIFSKTVELIRQKEPNCTVEILIPDFQGEESAFEIIMQNPPDILNHNLETVERLYHAVRPQANYQRSLDLVNWFHNKGLKTKSGIMVGIGEEADEVLSLMKDLKKHNCDIMTIGQYLQPTKKHLPVDRYVTLEEFKLFKDEGTSLGFQAVESGPLVRSSYHAEKHV